LEKRLKFEEIAVDMSPTTHLIAKKLHPYATIVDDRFHVWKAILEEITAIKIRLKTEMKKIARKRKKEKRYRN